MIHVASFALVHVVTLLFLVWVCTRVFKRVNTWPVAARCAIAASVFAIVPAWIAYSVTVAVIMQ